MERFLCLDIGDKRIGIAVSDPFNSYALPVCTYHRKNLKVDLEQIAKFVAEKGATAIVCGLPVNFDGTASIQTQKAQYFIQKLKEKLNIEIFTIDERCTTCEAEETLISQGMSREERKLYVDGLAASSILDGFLRERNLVKNKENIMEENKKKGCDCGCGMEDCNCENEKENCTCEEGCDCDCEDIVELTSDDGKKLKFYFVGTIEHKGRAFSAFEPAEEIEGISEDDLIIFEVSGDDEETVELLPIEDQDLLDEVFEEFCKALDEEE